MYLMWVVEKVLILRRCDVPLAFWWVAVGVPFVPCVYPLPVWALYYKQVSHFSTTILSAMLAGMDDREDPEDLITMEAMSGLSRIFSQIDEGHVRPILINIALRIRPCFEKVDPTHPTYSTVYTMYTLSCYVPVHFP